MTTLRALAIAVMLSALALTGACGASTTWRSDSVQTLGTMETQFDGQAPMLLAADDRVIQIDVAKVSGGIVYGEIMRSWSMLARPREGLVAVGELAEDISPEQLARYYSWQPQAITPRQEIQIPIAEVQWVRVFDQQQSPSGRRTGGIVALSVGAALTIVLLVLFFAGADAAGGES